MAAAAFTGTLVFSRGQEKMSRFVTISDVNGQYYTFSDGNTFLTLPSGGAWSWDELILSAAGTDTRTAQLYINGAATPLVIQNAANLYTTQRPQIAVTRPTIPGGSTIKLVQVT